MKAEEERDNQPEKENEPETVKRGHTRLPNNHGSECWDCWRRELSCGTRATLRAARSYESAAAGAAVSITSPAGAPRSV